MAAFRFFKRSRPLVAGESPFRGFWFWLFVAGSLAMAAVGVRGIVAEIQAGRWPSVRCEIMESRVTREMRYGEYRYVPWLRYRYIVSGRVYMSERIHLEPELTYDTFTSAESRLAAFPAGMKTICHVNPADPTQAVLQSKPDYVLLCISPFLLVIWALHERVADWWVERRRRKLADLPATSR